MTSGIEGAPTGVGIVTEGYPLPVWWRDHVVVLWWGPDELGDDRVAVLDGAPMLWEDVPSCLASARVAGVAAKEVELDVMELEPALLWLEGDGVDLAPVAALELWTLAADLRFSLGREPEDCDDTGEVVHAKLTAASAGPTGRVSFPDEATSGWTASELTYLRARLGRAAALLDEVFAPALLRPSRVSLLTSELDPTAPGGRP